MILPSFISLGREERLCRQGVEMSLDMVGSQLPSVGGRVFADRIAISLSSLCSVTLGFFAAAQNLESLIQPAALLDEFVRRSGIKFKHFKMAGYDDFGLDVLSQLGR